MNCEYVMILNKAVKDDFEYLDWKKMLLDLSLLLFYCYKHVSNAYLTSYFLEVICYVPGKKNLFYCMIMLDIVLELKNNKIRLCSKVI